MTNDRTLSKHEVSAIPTPVNDAGDGGVTRRDVLAVLAAFGVPSTALAQTPIPQDPVKVMPKNYRVAFENELVRVLEYNNRPGMGPCGAGLHYHPKHIDIFLTDFHGQLTIDGKVVGKGSVKAGDVKFYEAEFHEAENLDKTATRMFIVELKDANWKPSTG